MYGKLNFSSCKPFKILHVKLRGNLEYYLSPLYSTVVPPDDGSKVPASTLMGVLLMNDFQLAINKITYNVHCPKQEALSSELAAEMDTVKSMVHRLFTAIHFDEYQRRKETHLLENIDHLKKQLQPLEQLKARIEGRSEARINKLLWCGLALLSAQGGALAWFTWWVYSWDIMEPVTYFLTFANTVVFFAYFVVTRQDYTYSAVSGRQFLHFFYQRSKQEHFDVEQYNKLKDDLREAKTALRRLQRSLYFRLPVEQPGDKD
ncbi:calcium uniporter regulatory subunit MCUb, mitochondrial [Echinops telfairi]|uniref:Calcium uniporter regulatory subunit MCUb, mitochondrial n=1 Tax=Echinops telfairi TaxID=9371 RepID=A0AC55CK21_ECHTE|nr:calcium uniporter regulatory subunit MCUb, mitochondrial [Echinops telfairi]